jgi:hypothetical protein
MSLPELTRSHFERLFQLGTEVYCGVPYVSLGAIKPSNINLDMIFEKDTAWSRQGPTDDFGPRHRLAMLLS